MMSEPDDLPDDLLRLAASMPPAVFEHLLAAYKIGAIHLPDPMWCSYRQNCRAPRTDSPNEPSARGSDPRLRLRRAVRERSTWADRGRPAHHEGDER